MDWESIWKTAIAIIGSIGGAGAIICAVVKFSSDRIAERLSAKYQLKLNKELEQYKSLLSKKNYVSKTRFDTEFAVCKELMQACNNMINAVYYLFPLKEYESHYSDEQIKTQVYDQKYEKAIDASNKCKDLLASYAPFIAKELENEMKELHLLCGKNIEGFRFRYGSGPNYVEAPSEQRNAIVDECYDRTWEIRDKLSSISDTLRQYFKKMEVEEDKGE